jgi:hypothetical protein
LARWSMRRGPPLRTAIHAHSPLATRPTRTGRPHRPAPPSLWHRRRTPPRRAAPRCPCLDPWLTCVLVVTPSPRHERYKWSLARRRTRRHGHRAATAAPWTSRVERPSHWFFRPPNPPGTSLGSVGTPAAAPCTSRAAPSPALRLLRLHLPASAVPARRPCLRHK